MFHRHWYVRVDGQNTGRNAVVYVTRHRWGGWYGSDGSVVVRRVKLTDEDAEQQLSAARAEARSYAQQIESMDGARA